MLGCQLEPILWRQWVRASSRCFSASCLLASVYLYVCSVMVSAVLKAWALATLRPLPAASSTALLSLSSAAMARDRLSLVLRRSTSSIGTASWLSRKASSPAGSTLRSSSMVGALLVVHSPTRCLDSCWLVSSLLSSLLVKREVRRCWGRAPSARASSCILAPISSSPSSMMAFITSPAPFTMVRDGCWNSLNRVLPLAATFSSSVSNCLPSVVSL